MLTRILLTVTFTIAGVGALLYASFLVFVYLTFNWMDLPSIWDSSDSPLLGLLHVAVFALFGMWCLWLAVSTVVHSMPVRSQTRE